MDATHEQQRKRPRPLANVLGDDDDDDEDEIEQQIFRAKKARIQQKLRSAFDSIYEKYGQDFTGIGDEIDLETGKIVVDNGHVQRMVREGDNGNHDVPLSPATKPGRGRQPAWSTWTPMFGRGGRPLPTTSAPTLSADEEARNTDEETEWLVREDETPCEIQPTVDRRRTRSDTHSERRHAAPPVSAGEPQSDELLSTRASRRIKLVRPAQTYAQPTAWFDEGDESEDLGWTEAETERLIYLRRNGFGYTQMAPYFVGRHTGTIRAKWTHLLKEHPDLSQEQPPGTLLAQALAEFNAGRLQTTEGPRKRKRLFTKKEDDLLIRLRRTGFQWNEMVPHFRDVPRTASTLRTRLDKLCKVRPDLKNLRGRPPTLSVQALGQLETYNIEEDSTTGGRPGTNTTTRPPAAVRRVDATRDPWSAEEDSVILQLRARGVKFGAMSRFCKDRSEHTIRLRHQVLCTGDQNHGHQGPPPAHANQDLAVANSGDEQTRHATSRGSSPDSVVGERRTFDSGLTEEHPTSPTERFLAADEERPRPTRQNSRGTPSHEVDAPISELGYERATTQEITGRPIPSPRRSLRSTRLLAAKQVSTTDVEPIYPALRRRRQCPNTLPTPQTSASGGSPEPERTHFMPGSTIVDFISDKQRVGRPLGTNGNSQHSLPSLQEFSANQDQPQNTISSEQPLPEVESDLEEGFALEQGGDIELPLLCIDGDPTTSTASPQARSAPTVLNQGHSRRHYHEPIEDTEHETSLSAIASSFEAPSRKPVDKVKSDYNLRVQPSFDDEEKGDDLWQVRLDSSPENELDDPTFSDLIQVQAQEDGSPQFKPVSNASSQADRVGATADGNDEDEAKQSEHDDSSFDGQKTDDERTVEADREAKLASAVSQTGTESLNPTSPTKPRERPGTSSKASSPDPKRRYPKSSRIDSAPLSRRNSHFTDKVKAHNHHTKKLVQKRLSLPLADDDLTDDEIGQMHRAGKLRRHSLTSRRKSLRNSLSSNPVPKTPLRHVLQHLDSDTDDSSEDELCTPGRIMNR